MQEKGENMEILNVRLTPEEFQQEREEVLAGWPTGREVDLEDAVDYQKGLPREKVLAHLLAEAKAQGDVLLVSHGGRALLDEHIELLNALEEGGSDYLPTGVDAYTRNTKFEEAERSLEESKKTGRSLLSGVPVVGYGVKNCRKITEAVNQPIMTRTNSTDNRLVAETVLAGGFTGFEGGAICTFSCYSGKDRLPQVLRNYQYVNRLVGFYEERGVPIVRELPRCLIGAGGWPPCLDVVMSVCEALLAAEQGVRHILLQNVPQVSILQAVAQKKVSEKATNDYLQRFGYTNVQVFTLSGVWPGAFPADEAKSWAVIIHQAITAVLAGVQVHYNVKTVEEAHGLPSIKAQVDSTKACRQVVDMLKGQRYPESEALLMEMNILDLEASSILEKIFELGEGDVASGIVRAFEAGVMDVPFSPNKHVLGKVMPVRDCTGSVRFLDCGKLPFSHEVKAFHREKLAERGNAEGRSAGLEMVIDDVVGGLVSLSHKSGI